MPVLLCSMWLCHLISQINNSACYLCLLSDKSWKVCQEQSNGVIAISLNNRVYDSELVTTKIFILITYTFVKSVAFMSKDINSLPY